MCYRSIGNAIAQDASSAQWIEQDFSGSYYEVRQPQQEVVHNVYPPEENWYMSTSVTAR